MQDREVQRIVDASNFNRKEMPFRYLGIPICSKRISSKECSILAEKMTTRIKTWSAQNLSYLQYMLQGAGLISWESVCESKADGGAGFKKIAEWNVAGLFMYVWVVANKEDNL
uniref:Uncharacterized protein n=1 Tax=Cannabis sativa TaxID=3483 RepID=A0A803PXV7_CANSA